MSQELPTRQMKLDFGRSDVWEQLPMTDQQTCRQLLSLFMKELLLAERGHDHVHEPRKDSSTP